MSKSRRSSSVDSSLILIPIKHILSQYLILYVHTSRISANLSYGAVANRGLQLNGIEDDQRVRLQSTAGICSPGLLIGVSCMLYVALDSRSNGSNINEKSVMAIDGV